MNFLPEASRFNQLDDMEFAFGNMGLQDKAKHLATLYLEDLSDFIVEKQLCFVIMLVEMDGTQVFQKGCFAVG